MVADTADQFRALADLEASVWRALEEVYDPEIPVLSVLDLGIIRGVRIDDGHVTVAFMPTFLGCPATSMIRDAIAVRIADLAPVTVELVRDAAWSSDRITELGRRRLKEAGLAPPARLEAIEFALAPVAECPHCGSRSTLMESAFGPTPCRAIHYCRACRQPFEQFKAV